MAFYSLTDLQNRVIRRLRQVPGTASQLYSADIIADHIQETYQMCRDTRWWDHLTTWVERELDGTTGCVTVPFTGLVNGFKDIRQILWAKNSQPIPMIGMGLSPYAVVTGTTPRLIQPLMQGGADDPNGDLLFRVLPITTVTTAPDNMLRLQVRMDPTNIFTDPTVIVPFDATCLVNGAAASYAAGDGTSTADMTAIFQDRLRQLQMAHDNAVLMTDPRTHMYDTGSWQESWN